jgi:DNA polymerase-3 subunit beta
VTVHYRPGTEADTKAGVAYAAPFAGFSDETRTVTFRSEYGEFPRYRALMPGQADTSAMVDAGALSAAVKRAAVLAERNAPVHLTFDPGASRVVIQAGTDGRTAGEESVDAIVDGAGPGTVGYNPDYLMSLLAGVTGDAWLSWQAPAKPLVVSSTDDTDPYRALICPIKLAGN